METRIVTSILLLAIVSVSLILYTSPVAYAQENAENAVFSVSPGAFTVPDVPPGTLYTAPQQLVVWNRDNIDRVVTIRSEIPPENSITPGYVPIPNENWVTPFPSTVLIKSDNYAIIDLSFNLPRWENLTNQNMEVWMPVERQPLSGEIGILTPTVRIDIQTTAELPPLSGQGVTVSVSPASRSGMVGQTLNYSVTVKNTGVDADTFNLQTADTLGWGPTLSVTSTTLAAGASRSGIILNVTVPSSASENEVSTMTITATGTGYMDSATCTATAIKSSTTLTIYEENFALQAGESKILTATLHYIEPFSEGTIEGALSGENITWSATAGSIVPLLVQADTLGQVTALYTAPNYETSVIVSASYTGSDQYEPSSANSYGTISAPTPAPSSGISTEIIIGIAIVVGCVILGAAIAIKR